jgi:hypothetical protein
LSTIPPAIPTAVAPTATAGPLTLLAAPLIVPTTPPFPVPFRLAALRLALVLLVRRAVPLRLAGAFFRGPPLPDVDREAFDRLLVAAFERLRDEALFELPLDLGLDLDPEPLDAARAVPCPLREAGWLAILSSPR